MIMLMDCMEILITSSVHTRKTTQVNPSILCQVWLRNKRQDEVSGELREARERDNSILNSKFADVYKFVIFKLTIMSIQRKIAQETIANLTKLSIHKISHDSTQDK